MKRPNSDLQSQAIGVLLLAALWTGPGNSSVQAEPERLGLWTFDAPAGAPVEASAVAGGNRPGPKSVPGLAGLCLQFPVAEMLSAFSLPAQGDTRRTILNPREGCVQFAFRPDWSGSNGPGTAAVLLQVGSDAKPGTWALQINPAGTLLELVQSDGRRESAVARAPVRFRPGEWVVLSVNYSERQRCQFFTNGVPSADPAFSPRALSPAAAGTVQVSLGSDSEGRRSARGSIDEFETLVRPLDAEFVWVRLTAPLWAAASNGPPAIHFRWQSPPNQSWTLQRRDAFPQPWTVVESNLTGWTAVDTNITPGRRYEYRLTQGESTSSNLDRWMAAAVAMAPVHDRGTVLVLVDETMASELNKPLRLLESDLANEGWRVVQRNAPRHEDGQWAANPPRIRQVKEMVLAENQAAEGGLAAIFIVGHVVIPHSGSARPDGHQTRPLPVDFYYGDMIANTNDWTDVRDFQLTPYQNRPGISNRAGDGIFDAQRFPSAIETPVGRADFSSLPTFSQRPPAGLSRRSEAELLALYLDKAHRYRRGELRFADAAGVYRLPAPYKQTGNAAALTRNAAAWFPEGLGAIRWINFFRHPEPGGLLWGFAFGMGDHPIIGAGAPSEAWTVADLADPAKEKSVGFYLLVASYIGDWSSSGRPVQDSFLRALLAQKNSGLGAIWGLGHSMGHSLQGMGLGDPIGPAWVGVLREHGPRDGMVYFSGDIHQGLLGDPTLRHYHQTPVKSLKARRSGKVVSLRWSGANAGAHVYRSERGHLGPFVRLTPDRPATDAFEDREAPRRDVWYQVRPEVLVISGCGSYLDLGPGETVLVD